MGLTNVPSGRDALGIPSAPFDCRGRDEVFRSVRLRRVPAETADAMTVEARLRIIRHRAWVAPDGMLFPGFEEYRLVDGGRVER
jgi:hypothetical protein